MPLCPSETEAETEAEAGPCLCWQMCDTEASCVIYNCMHIHIVTAMYAYRFTVLLHYKCTLFSNFTSKLSRIEIMQIPSKIYIFYYIKYKPCAPSVLVARINYARFVSANLPICQPTDTPTHRPVGQPTKQRAAVECKKNSACHFYYFHFMANCASTYFLSPLLLLLLRHLLCHSCTLFLDTTNFFCRWTNFYKVIFAAQQDYAGSMTQHTHTHTNSYISLHT